MARHRRSFDNTFDRYKIQVLTCSLFFIAGVMMNVCIKRAVILAVFFIPLALSASGVMAPQKQPLLVLKLS